MIVIISHIFFDSTTQCTSVVCMVCTSLGEAVTGVEPNCDIRCRPDQLTKITIKLLHAVKILQKQLKIDSLNASVVISDNTNVVFNTLIRKLRLGFLLREACMDILKGKALKKMITTLFDPLDLSIFNFDKQSAIFSIENNFAILDELMGSTWDVYYVNQSAPQDHFNFIRAIGVSVNSLKTTFVLAKGKSIYPFSINYRELAVASLRSASDNLSPVMLGVNSSSQNNV